MGNLEWLICNVFEHEPVPEGKTVYAWLDENAAGIAPEACDVYFLPFLYGSNRHSLAGGAANSSLWVQIHADVLELPVETVSSVKELGALGAGMPSLLKLWKLPLSTLLQKLQPG